MHRLINGVKQKSARFKVNLKYHMILNIEIDDEIGAKLDALAKSERRSRRAQATCLMEDVILSVWENDFHKTAAPTTTRQATPTEPAAA